MQDKSTGVAEVFGGNMGSGAKGCRQSKSRKVQLLLLRDCVHMQCARCSATCSTLEEMVHNRRGGQSMHFVAIRNKNSAAKS